jgi:AcrR family transcriptional regulator
VTGAGPPDGESEGGADRALSFIEQARRRQIVDAAIETLAESGYAGATFARIAERAGISPSLISYHFARKQDLLAEVLTSIIGSMDAALTADVEDAASYPDALRALIESSVRFFAARSTEVRALEQLFSQTPDPAVATSAEEHHASTLTELEDLFREGQAAGELGDFPTRPMAVTLQAALESVPAELHSRPETDVDAYATALADIFAAATAPRR